MLPARLSPLWLNQPRPVCPTLQDFGAFSGFLPSHFRFPPWLWLSGDSRPNTKLLFVLAVPLHPSGPPTRHTTLDEALGVIRSEGVQQMSGQRAGQVSAARKWEVRMGSTPRGGGGPAPPRGRLRPRLLGSNPWGQALLSASAFLSGFLKQS